MKMSTDATARQSRERGRTTRRLILEHLFVVHMADYPSIAAAVCIGRTAVKRHLARLLETGEIAVARKACATPGRAIKAMYGLTSTSESAMLDRAGGITPR